MNTSALGGGTKLKEVRFNGLDNPSSKNAKTDLGPRKTESPPKVDPPAKPKSLAEVDHQDIFLDDFEFYEKLGSGSYG